MKTTRKISNNSKTVLQRATRKASFVRLPSSLLIMKVFTTMVLLVLISSGTVWAQGRNSSVTQTLTLEVRPITRLSVTGNPNSLIISDAVLGSDLSSVSDDNTKYSLTTNLDNMKIVASINDKMPAGTKLMVKLSSSKAASAGLVDVSGAVSPVDVVTGLSRGSDMNQSISYTFAANSGVYEVPTQTRVVTLTLTN
jgi:hypothetical protein